MKKNLFLYLFIFAALIALYQFKSAANLEESLSRKIGGLNSKVVMLKDSVEATQLRLLDNQYFSLANNDDALAYYEHLNLENPTLYIEDKLLETNEERGDNPLVPYEGLADDFKINKIKVLNHRWILADFSDGKYWGDLVIRYELKDNLGVDFKVMDHLLYTRSN